MRSKLLQRRKVAQYIRVTESRGRELSSPKSENAQQSRERMGKTLGPTGEFFKRRDEWRKHPMLGNQLRHATPGLGIALVAFGIYLVGEQVYNRVYAPSSSHHHQRQSSSHSH